MQDRDSRRVHSAPHGNTLHYLLAQIFRPCAIPAIIVGFTNNRAYVRCGQILSKYFYYYRSYKNTRAFLYKSCQNILTAVQFTKRRAILYNSCQNCAILLYRNNISRALPENYAKFKSSEKAITNLVFNSRAKPEIYCYDRVE